MFDKIIKQKLNKIMVDVPKNNLRKNTANKQLNEMLKITKFDLMKGHKREVKNEIFKVKKFIGRF